MNNEKHTYWEIEKKGFHSEGTNNNNDTVVRGINPLLLSTIDSLLKENKTALDVLSFLRNDYRYVCPLT